MEKDFISDKITSRSMKKNGLSFFEKNIFITPTGQLVLRKKAWPVFLKVVLAGLFFGITLFWSLRPVFAAEISQQNEEERDAARGMEALFVNQLINEMRKSVPENDLIPKSQAEKIYESMLDYEYSRILSDTANFGIEDQVLAEIQRRR